MPTPCPSFVSWRLPRGESRKSRHYCKAQYYSALQLRQPSQIRCERAPGAAITPLEQGEALFALLGRKPRFRHVPVRLLDGIILGLRAASRIAPSLAAKAEFARIGRYYATESMLVLDPATGRYDAAATPSTGTETLHDHYAALVADHTRI